MSAGAAIVDADDAIVAPSAATTALMVVDGGSGEAAQILSRHRSPETPVFVGRNLGRSGERHWTIRLATLAEADIDMLTIVLVGSSRTRCVEGDPPRLYTPRGYFAGARN